MDPTRLWEGGGVLARAVRGVLTPASWLFEGLVAGRNAMFDAGVLRSHPLALPALSVGNLSVGGTGKTPIAADIAGRLRAAGGHPALLLRGYGDDEPAVHALLNPDVPVLTSPDRVVSAEAALARGCDMVVLDDAFQHRRARRIVDVVLVAAEQWRRPIRCLPAGPYREPLSALARATLVIVTRKSTSAEVSHDIEGEITRLTAAPVTRVAFALDSLRRVGGSGETRALTSLDGAKVLAIAAIGAPRAFARQLEDAGARVELVSFPDHHRFSAGEVAALVARAPASTCVVCTLKDAVKLESVWPRASTPLWYVSQRIALEAGEPAYASAMQQLLSAREHDPSIR